MTEHYTERYAGECRCGRGVQTAIKVRMGQNSPADVWVRCAKSDDITNAKKVRE